MPSDVDDLIDYEVCFTVSPDNRTELITYVKPDHIFYGHRSEDVVFKVKAISEEEAEDEAFKMLTDPGGQYVKKYGPGFEVKKKHVWHVIYM